jgi:hypothetical protein
VEGQWYDYSTPPDSLPQDQMTDDQAPAAELADLVIALNRLIAVLDKPPIDRILTLKDFACVIRVSTTVFDRLRSAGKLPRPDLVIARSPRWRVETVRRFLEGGRP